MLKKVWGYFAIIVWYIISCFAIWKLGKRDGVLNERKENAERRIDSVASALAVRRNADLDRLRKRYKISDE